MTPSSQSRLWSMSKSPRGLPMAGISSPTGAPEVAAATVVQEKPPEPSKARGIFSRLTGAGGLMWQRPGIDLLRQAPEMSISKDELKDTAETITQTLGEYGVEVEVGHVRPGPTVTMYGLVPGWIRRTRVVKQVDKDGIPLRDESGRQINKREEQKTRVKVDSILAREKDLALALRTPSIRIETPAMGKSLVGIEVPNPNPSLVTLRNVMESREFQKLRGRTLICRSPWVGEAAARRSASISPRCRTYWSPEPRAAARASVSTR